MNHFFISLGQQYLSGVVFFRRSLLALSASVIVAAIFMFTAHLTNIDPQITNLVPVLKSYWLTIHVSVLTASYGFFGLAAILGYMALIMFIFRKNRPHLDDNIKSITAISEIALIIGLSAITIGNFLVVFGQMNHGVDIGDGIQKRLGLISQLLFMHLFFI